jgi:hypothetical protein
LLSDQNNTKAWYRRGQAYEALKKYKDAEADLRRFVTEHY